MTADDRQRIRDARDLAARRSAQEIGLFNVPLVPLRVRYCEALKGYTASGAGERCSNVARKGSTLCGLHVATAAGVFRRNGSVAA